MADRLRIDIVNAAAFQRRIRAASRMVKKEVEREVLSTGLNIESDIKKSMRTTPKGRPVKRRGKRHRPSLPGNPPAVDTGNLIRNITVEREFDGGVTVGSRRSAPYGKFLEEGTSNMEERPWLAPAVEKNQDGFLRRLDDILSRIDL